MKENHIQVSLPRRVILAIEKEALKKGVSKGVFVKILLLERFGNVKKSDK